MHQCERLAERASRREYANTSQRMSVPGNPVVDVLENGAVCLGPQAVCDGYAVGRPFRIQTHVHDDHMGDFDTSKGLQRLYMSPPTRALLIAERDAELEYRDNLIAVQPNTPRRLPDGSVLRLLPSGHMLGSSQVALELPSGTQCGYSGDFGWPLDQVIQVEQLVVDSTYGNPGSVRQYSQDEAESSASRGGVRAPPLRLGAYQGPQRDDRACVACRRRQSWGTVTWERTIVSGDSCLSGSWIRRRGIGRYRLGSGASSDQGAFLCSVVFERRWLRERTAGRDDHRV